MINDKQVTVILHVDDLKVSHVDENKNTKSAEWMKTKYILWRKLTVHRGKNMII